MFLFTYNIEIWTAQLYRGFFMEEFEIRAIGKDILFMDFNF